MTPFQQFRVWFGRAPAPERATTTIAGLVLVALVAFLVVPVHRGGASTGFQVSGGQTAASQSGPTGASNGLQTGGVPGAAGGSAAAGRTDGGGSTPSASAISPTGGVGTGGTSGVVGVVGVGGVPGGGDAATAATGHCPPGTDQGITGDQINAAVTLVNIGGAVGNSAIGVPSPAEQQADWQEVADAINASGGAACHKLAMHFYTVNPVDSSNAQQQCLQIAADKPFIVFDVGALAAVGASDCIPQQKIPMLSTYVSSDQVKTYYPYYINPGGLQADVLRSGFGGAAKKGFFSATSGFRKLGIVYQNCRPAIVAAGRSAIRQAGIPDNATVTYNLGCPPGNQGSPADYQQAVLTFRNAGVTHVTEINDGSIALFTKAAGQQNYRPRYVFADDALAVGSSGALAPDANNLDGAVDLLGQRWGESNTPGYQPNAETARCNAVFAKHGQPPVYQQADGFGGATCHYLWIAQSMIDHVSQLQRTALVGGLRGVGVFGGVFPYGLTDFSLLPAGTAYGLESWRVDQFAKACSCWRVADPMYNAPIR